MHEGIREKGEGRRLEVRRRSEREEIEEEAEEDQ